MVLLNCRSFCIVGAFAHSVLEALKGLKTGEVIAVMKANYNAV